MRQCALCQMITDDETTTCPSCGADLLKDSVRAHALKSIIESPRVGYVSVVAPDPACPVCHKHTGSFEKTSPDLPVLPHVGCSCPNGCLCRYEPLLLEVGP